MDLFAWIGEDEFGSGVVGIKQGRTAAGLIAIVATRRHKIDTPAIREQLAAQARTYGVKIRLARFTYAEDLNVLEPDQSFRPDDQPSFTCPKCGIRSFNPNDVHERYCGSCHEFFV